MVPGYLPGAWGFRQELRALLALGAGGGALGALLLLVTPATAFGRIVPWLLLAATAIFALAPRLLEAALMTVGAAVGGYAGARLARRIPGAWLRAGIVATGLAMAAAFWGRS